MPLRGTGQSGLTDIARRSRGGTAVAASHDAVDRRLLVAFDAGQDPGTFRQDDECQAAASRSQNRSWRQAEMKLAALPLPLNSMKPPSRSSLTPVASSSGAAPPV
jgi:hypothetical protein